MYRIINLSIDRYLHWLQFLAIVNSVATDKDIPLGCVDLAQKWNVWV